MWNPFSMLSRAIVHFQTNKKYEEVHQEINDQLLGLKKQILAIEKNIAVLNENIIVLDEQNKRLNSVNEIMCAVQQELLEQLVPDYGTKKMYIFPYGSPDDDDLPN